MPFFKRVEEENTISVQELNWQPLGNEEVLPLGDASLNFAGVTIPVRIDGDQFALKRGAEGDTSSVSIPPLVREYDEIDWPTRLSEVVIDGFKGKEEPVLIIEPDWNPEQDPLQRLAVIWRPEAPQAE